MPTGQQLPVTSDADIVYPIPASELSPAPPTRIERSSGGDLWHQQTLAPGDFSGGIAVVTLRVPAMVLEIYADEELVIGLDTAAPSLTPGGYNLWHPGGAELAKVIKPATTIALRTITGAAPAQPVEFLAMAGLYVQVRP